MANVPEERVEATALKGDYQFGFHDTTPISPCFVRVKASIGRSSNKFPPSRMNPLECETSV